MNSARLLRVPEIQFSLFLQLKPPHICECFVATLAFSVVIFNVVVLYGSSMFKSTCALFVGHSRPLLFGDAAFSRGSLLVIIFYMKKTVCVLRSCVFDVNKRFEGRICIMYNT